MNGITIDISKLAVDGTIKIIYNQQNTATSFGLLFNLRGSEGRVAFSLNTASGGTNPPVITPLVITPSIGVMSVQDNFSSTIWISDPSNVISKSTDAFVYDPNGNLTKQSTTENNQTTHKQYGYNENNQLISYIALDGSASSYTYYADGLRKSKTVQNQTTTFYYHGDDIINEAIAGQLTATNLKTYGIMGRITPTGYRSYVKDSHSDVVKMLNAQGTQVVSYQYEG